MDTMSKGLRPPEEEGARPSRPLLARLRKARHFSIRVFWALGDHALMSLATFLSNILLARWLSPADFGVFAYVSSVYLLILGFVWVLFIEPLTIFGASRHAKVFRPYVGRQAALLGVACFAVMLMVTGGFLTYEAFAEAEMATTFIFMSVALPFTLLGFLLRRVQYLKTRPTVACLLAAINLVMVLGAIAAFHGLGILSSASGFAAMALGGLPATLIVLTRYVLGGWSAGASAAAQDPAAPTASLPVSSPRFPAEPAPITLRRVARENWDYGSWLLVSTLTYWLTRNSYYVMVGELIDPESAGFLRATYIVVSPLDNIFAALSALFLPAAARSHAERGLRGLERLAVRYTLPMTGIALGFLVLIWIGGEAALVRLLGDRYAGLGSLLIWIAMPAVVTALTLAWSCGLRIREMTARVLWVDLLGALLTLAAGPPLILAYGLDGAVAGMVVSAVARVPMLVLLWRLPESRVARIRAALIRVVSRPPHRPGEP